VTQFAPAAPAGPAPDEAAPVSRRRLVLRRLRQAFGSGPALISLVILILVLLMAVFAPLLATADPVAINPAERLSGATADHPLGTDAYGRDTFSRVLYGARVSLLVGAGAAIVSVAIGLVIGVIAGYFRALDSIIMRTMDGVMAIPSILLAIALISLTGASLMTVLVAITIPEIPRVVRLVRSVILNVRSETYVEAAITLGSPVRRILLRHMVPNTIAPLIVQGTFVFASAILTEATLSFLGAGLPTEIPSWGNIMSEGRSYFQLFPGLVLWPGVALALTLLSVNVLGDVLRDTLDPKMEKRT